MEFGSDLNDPMSVGLSYCLLLSCLSKASCLELSQHLRGQSCKPYLGAKTLSKQTH